MALKTASVLSPIGLALLVRNGSLAQAALEPIVQARQAIGRIDTQLQGLQAQQTQLDERVKQERENLLAIQKKVKALSG